MSISALLGTVSYHPRTPATDRAVWITLLPSADLAVDDLVLIEDGHDQMLGSVTAVELTHPAGVPTAAISRTTLERRAHIALLSSSHRRLRPPVGTRVRHPSPIETTTLLAEARLIAPEQRVPLAVLPTPDGYAPLFADLRRLVGPIATSMLISGAAGSQKTTAGGLVLAGIRHVTQGQAAVVIINSKGADFLFAEYARQDWERHPQIPPLRPADLAMYAAMGYATPPTFAPLTVFVPHTSDRAWQSLRPADFPNTETYALSQQVAIAYAASPTDEDERATSVVTRQCIEEVAGPFAAEFDLTTLPAITAALRDIVANLSERGRWRNFLATTVAAALRQLQAAERDLGPILAARGVAAGFPVERLAKGGTWVIDVAPLPQRAAQAVLDAVVSSLTRAKAQGTLPLTLPLVLLVDELNRWSAVGPTAARLAAIVRDQRYRRVALIGLGQQLSTLHPQLLANADAMWMGTTRSLEASDPTYATLPAVLRTRLHRLPPGQRVLDMWPFAQPLLTTIPYPAWLTADEGLVVLEATK